MTLLIGGAAERTGSNITLLVAFCPIEGPRRPNSDATNPDQCSQYLRFKLLHREPKRGRQVGRAASRIAAAAAFMPFCKKPTWIERSSYRARALTH